MNTQRLSYMIALGAIMALLLSGCGLLDNNLLDSNNEAAVIPAAQTSSTVVESILAVDQTAADVLPAQAQQPAAVPQAVAPAVVDTAADTAAVAPATAPLAIAPDLLEQEQLYIGLYERVNPAVVSVLLTGGGGSGFIIDSQGYIVTNNHVVAQGGPVFVGFADGDRREAEVLGTDPQADIALLKVEVEPGEQLPVVPLGNSDALQVGQIVVAIGSPFGLDNTMTTGIVSGLSRALPTDDFSSFQVPDVIQTDAAINPGNSGGPLLTLDGEVVGVNTAIESPVRANSGVGFAVPANVVSVVVAQLRDNGQVTYPWLGIAGGTLSPEFAEEMGLDRELRGVIISTVVAGGPADQAGLRGGDETTGIGGDVVTAIDGRIINEFDDLLGYIVQQTRVGQAVELTVTRQTETVTINLTLGARPEEPEVPSTTP